MSKRNPMRDQVLARYDENGGNAAEAGKAFGVSGGRVRHWVIERRTGIKEKRVKRLDQQAPTAAQKIEFQADRVATPCLDVIASAARSGLTESAARRLIIEAAKKFEQEATGKKKPPRVHSYTTRKGSRHIVIPDVQAKPGQDFTFLRDIGNYIAAKRPDVLVQIGDFVDFPAFSSYDKGKASSWNKTYRDDFDAGREAMAALMGPILAEKARSAQEDETPWNPLMILTWGNHEQRVLRAQNEDGALKGSFSLEDLGFEDYGWICFPFLEVVKIDGICFSHYITTGVMGRPAASPRAMLNKKHQSCVMGHVQGDRQESDFRADGKKITGVMVGCCYEHDEDYLGPQGNHYWRGIWIFNRVDEGSFTTEQKDLQHLRENYRY